MLGAQILLFADGLARAADAERALRLALLASGADARLLFPAEFGLAPAAEDGGGDPDYRDVAWQVPDAGEWERVQAALAGARHVSVRLPEDPDGGWV